MPRCPSCGGRHATNADVRSCMAESVREKRRNKLREAFDLQGDDE